ncbi:hypothetical protein L873DRAFT_1925324 [Choiromyces venosus 120613-1]|uniref:Uncharacterized protein n=1 Tax=Choiromyces venosus 120613-1 TaxID=1336337 RepID=A0A3N4JDG0_9PEZI|nr:hypothetical protein L873DRAFT_1925324 [Choiromyces venosus 120613-1]
MDYQPFVPWGRDQSQCSSTLPQTYFPQGGNNTPRPARTIAPQTIRAGPLGYDHIPNSQGKGSAKGDRHPGPEMTNSEECVQKFNHWRSRKGEFSSPEWCEKELTMGMSMRDFILFKKILGTDQDEKFPKYSYNSSTSTLTIRCMSNAVHENLVSVISNGFVAAKLSLPAHIRNNVETVGNQLFDEFHERYAGSMKVPDTALKITNAAGKTEIKFVLEVGFSEEYEKLVEDVTMWLEGCDDVCVAMLVMIQEAVKYECPTRHLSDEEVTELEFPSWQDITQESFDLLEARGPAVYKGLTWVEAISGWVEIWRRDPQSRLAARSGDRMGLLGPTIGQVRFRLREFLDVRPEHDREITFDWDGCLNRLSYSIRELAAFRCREMLIDREGRADIRDPDYQPPSPISS